MSTRQKLVVLGLDSLPPELTLQLARDGVMPFIAELLEKGSFGPLRSIMPANTGGAWNSAWTGRLPREHGYFGFYHYDPADDTIRISTSDRLRQTTLWQMLNEKGWKTLVINSPMQFPATPVDGVMVSGFMTPSLASPCSWPAEFKDRLAGEIPDYVFDVRWQKRSDEESFAANIEAVIKAFEQRVQVSKLAAARGQWDALLIVFKSIDNMLHYTWDYLSEETDQPGRRALTLKAFAALDDACKALAQLAGYPDCNILVCSDHGHGGIKGHLYVNRLLAQWGYLHQQGRLGRMGSKLVTSCCKRLGIERAKKKPSAYIGRRFGVEWPRSQALMISSGVIYLNVQGRQPEGVVDPQAYQSLRETLAQKLRSLKDENGDALIMEIECPAEAGAEPVPAGKPAIPDIVFEPADGVVLRSTTTRGPTWFAGHVDDLQGCHRVNGIVLGAGPAFAPGNSVQGDLVDVAPTALAACGLAIPQGLTGKTIANLLHTEMQVKIEADSAVADRGSGDSRQGKTGSPPASGEGVYNKEEEAKITQRLADLGYLE